MHAVVPTREPDTVNPNDLPSDAGAAADSGAPVASDLLSPLLQGSASGGTAGAAATSAADTISGVLLGELLALGAEGQAPLVRYPGQRGTQALAARSTVDLHGLHIGQPVVLMFEQGDPSRPVVLGVLRGQVGWPLDEKPAQVDVDADGQRMIVSAKEQLVLRCGKASISLTKTGKVLIEGSYVVSRSSGVNRVQGGSVQLN
jgi:hypothetical protein